MPTSRAQHRLFASIVFVSALSACRGAASTGTPAPETVAPTTARTQDGAANGGSAMNDDKVVKTDAEWKAILSPGTYRIMREQGTEPAFSGEYWDNHEKGVYVCAACGNPLFTSDQKFESGTGWPSFWAPVKPGAVDERTDTSHFMTRTEIVCHKCGGHLGHVFDDGPQPTGLRYCMNSGALKFQKQ